MSLVYKDVVLSNILVVFTGLLKKKWVILSQRRKQLIEKRIRFILFL